MMIKLKPNCTIDKLPNGQIRVRMKEGLSEEIKFYLINEPFDKIDIGEGDWSDLEVMLQCSSKIKLLSIGTNNVDWDVISKLDSLERLFIRGKFKGCPELHSLSNLKHLSVYWSDCYEENCKNLSDLVSLDLVGFGCSNLEPLGRMDSLEYLSIQSSRKLNSLNGISNCSKLKFVEIEGSTALSNAEGLTRLPNLEYLRLANCKSDYDYSFLSQLSSLKEISLSGEMKDLKCLRGLASLEMIRFDCKLDDGELDFLYEMPKLKFVLFNNKKNYSVKIKDIQKHLEEKGFDQASLRLEGAEFSDVFKS